MRSSDRRRGVAVNPGLEVVVVSGLSGSGKSTAIHVLEDLGYYCIDNLPVVLVPRLLELCSGAHQRLDREKVLFEVRRRNMSVNNRKRFFPQVIHKGRKNLETSIEKFK